MLVIIRCTSSSRRLLLIAFVFGCAATASVGQAQQLASAETVKSYAATFDKWSAKHHPNSAILVIRRDGKTVFITGIGTDPNKPTLIGSLSKPITGACIATLVRDGKLSFQTKMREALAGFFTAFGRAADQRFEDVTVEQLLVHRAGFPGSKEGDPIFAIWGNRAENGLGYRSAPQPLLAEHLRNKLVRNPGVEMSYSNTGYIALTAIIEERSGRSYENYCRDRIFRELSIDARLHPDWSMYSGSGGWIIAGADYLKFLDIFDPKHPFLGNDANSWINYGQSRWKQDSQRDWYSLGVGTSNQGGRRAVWHTGLMNSRGKNVQGNAITATVRSAAVRNFDGTGIFIAVTPHTITDKALRELRRERQPCSSVDQP